jgi:hypothetical protein
MVGANEVQKSGTGVLTRSTGIERASAEDPRSTRGRPARATCRPNRRTEAQRHPTASCTGRRLVTHRRGALGGSALLDLCSLKTNRGLESRRAWNALTFAEPRSRIIELVAMKPFDNTLFPWTIALLASCFGSIATTIGLERSL